LIDGRDLARWVIRMAEHKKAGIYNATGPAERLTLEQFLEACKETSGTDVTLIWASASFLAEQQVKPWRDLPLWVPEAMRGLLQVDTTKATSDGLVFRPLSETIHDTLTWAQRRAADYVWQAGLSPEHEATILAQWYQIASSS